jgi:hypothetical protein
MEDLEELEIERRGGEIGFEEREQTDEDGESMENEEGSAIGVVMDPADDERDE